MTGPPTHPGPPCPLLRPTTRAERRLSVVCAAALGGVAAMTAAVVRRDVPVLAVSAVVVIGAAAVIAVLVGWWRRVQAPSVPRFRDLEPTHRWAVRRALFTGRLGDPADRPYVRFWLGRRLRYPTNPTVFIGAFGWNLAITPPDVTGDWVRLEWGLLGVLGVVQLLFRRYWIPPAERLDAELAAPADPPAGPSAPTSALP